MNVVTRRVATILATWFFHERRDVAYYQVILPREVRAPTSLTATLGLIREWDPGVGKMGLTRGSKMTNLNEMIYGGWVFFVSLVLERGMGGPGVSQLTGARSRAP